MPLGLTSPSGTLEEATFGKEAGHERISREGNPCRRVLLGDAGSLPEATGRCLHAGRIHGRRRSERDLPQPRHARGGDRDRLRPERTSYRELLEFFFQIHDPTTLNRQGNDIGTSYRSAIFYLDEQQRRVAEEMIADVDASGRWPGEVVTEVTPAGPFWEAEPEHQNYLERKPYGYTCHFVRPDWVLAERTKTATG